VIPVVTIPAIESDSTALYLGYLRVRGLAPWGWLVWIGFLAGLHALFGFTTWDLIGVCVGVSSWLGWVVWRMRFARWAQLVEPLLRAQPWRPVEATLRGRRIVAGDSVFARQGMPRRVRNVIAPSRLPAGPLHRHLVPPADLGARTAPHGHRGDRYPRIPGHGGSLLRVRGVP
jgi:hypothetical protein